VGAMIAGELRLKTICSRKTPGRGEFLLQVLESRRPPDATCAGRCRCGDGQVRPGDAAAPACVASVRERWCLAPRVADRLIKKL